MLAKSQFATVTSNVLYDSIRSSFGKLLEASLAHQTDVSDYVRSWARDLQGQLTGGQPRQAWNIAIDISSLADALTGGANAEVVGSWIAQVQKAIRKECLSPVGYAQKTADYAAGEMACSLLIEALVNSHRTLRLDQSVLNDAIMAVRPA